MSQSLIPLEQIKTLAEFFLGFEFLGKKHSVNALEFLGRICSMIKNASKIVTEQQASWSVAWV